MRNDLPMMNVFLLTLFFLLDGAALQRPPKRCRLPDGITDFEEMRKYGYCYVDKTKFISKMLECPLQKFHFIARPKKFGKSLFCRTLETVFWGKKQLFKGLSIHATHNFKVYPVIYLDFSGFGMECENHTVYAEELVRKLKDTANEIIKTHQDLIQNHQVQIHAENHNDVNVQSSLSSLVSSLKRAFLSEVAIVIDEYDSFITHNLDKPTLVTDVWHKVLQPFYSTIKALERHLRFVFITGVAPFTQSYLYSSMNNLNDVSRHDEYAEMLGFTVKEMKYFAPEIKNIVKCRREKSQDNATVSREMEEIRRYYDGYQFTAGGSRMFHPSFLMSYLSNKDHQVPADKIPAPPFLFKILPRHQYSAKLLTGMNVTAQDFRGALMTDPNNLELAPLLFHNGIFSIKKYDCRTDTYFLHYPNQRVKEYYESPTFEKLMEPMGGLDLDYRSFADRCTDMTKFLLNGDEESVKLYFEKLDNVLAIRRGHGTYPRNSSADYQFTAEGAFQSMVEICLDCSKEGRITMEKRFAHGRGDIEFQVVRQSKTILFQTMAGESIGVKKALNRLLLLDAGVYLNEKRIIVCVTVSFSLETRLLEDWIYVEYDELGNRRNFFSMKKRDVAKMDLHNISLSDPNSSNIH